MVFIWGGAFHYEVIDEFDHLRITFDKLVVGAITWIPYMAIVAWLEELRHIPYMTITRYIFDIWEYVIEIYKPNMVQQ